VRETWEGWLRLLTKAERFPPPNHSEQFVRVAWTSLDRSLPPRIVMGRHRRDHRSPRRSDYRTLFYFHELLLRALRGNAKLASIRLPPRLTIDRDEPGYRQWRAEIRSYQEAANARVKRLAKA